MGLWISLYGEEQISKTRFPREPLRPQFGGITLAFVDILMNMSIYDMKNSVRDKHNNQPILYKWK